MPRLLDRNPDGTTEWFHFDAMTGDFHIETRQDIEPILEDNKARQNHDGGGWTPSRDMRHAAHIPNAIIMEWKRKHGVDLFNKNHIDGVKRLLNSNEYRHLRTALWRI